MNSWHVTRRKSAWHGPSTAFAKQVRRSGFPQSPQRALNSSNPEREELLNMCIHLGLHVRVKLSSDKLLDGLPDRFNDSHDGLSIKMLRADQDVDLSTC